MLFYFFLLNLMLCFPMFNRYNRAKIVINDNLLHYCGGKFYIFYIIYNKKRAKEAVCAILAEYRLFLLRFSVFT